MIHRYIWDDFAWELPLDKVLRRLHIQDEEDAALIRPYYEKAMELARPKALIKECFVDSIAGDAVTIDGITFHSAAMASHLKDIHRVFAYITTCGSEVDEWSHSVDDYIMSLWLDMLKEMILGECMKCFFERVKKQNAITKFATLNPGSGDADVWPIAQQVGLFELIGDVEADIGVRLKPSYLMLPTKSTSGILFPTSMDYVNCVLCTRETCPNRRGPYDAQLAAQMKS